MSKIPGKKISNLTSDCTGRKSIIDWERINRQLFLSCEKVIVSVDSGGNQQLTWRERINSELSYEKAIASVDSGGADQ